LSKKKSFWNERRTPLFSNYPINFHENTVRFDAEEGNYLVVALTERPGEEAEFYLRVLINNETKRIE